MEVAYNLRYQKYNFTNKPILDKEGEVIVYAKGFRLRGKGAGDKGELLNFAEIKEFYYREEKIFFITFSKEKYVLSESGTLYDQLLIDLYKSRNEFLMDALFMKHGKMKAEFEGAFERSSKFGKLINKGPAILRLYEGSLVIIPELQDAFALPYDFMNFYEFDSMEYRLKLTMDDGVQLMISHLGNEFEIFEEKWNSLLGGMYAVIVNDVLKDIFAEFHAGTLLKLAYKMKGGKAVSLKEIKKMDEELAQRIDDFIFEDEDFKEKTTVLRNMVDDYNLHFGISRDETVEGSYIRWVLFAIPESNIVAFSILPRWKEGAAEGASKKKEVHDTYFYRIIMEKGNAADKAEDKIKEVNQALVNLSFMKDPCYKDKRDLRHSPFKYAIRKMPFLRILRKSFVGRVAAEEVKDWQKQVEVVLAKAKI